MLDKLNIGQILQLITMLLSGAGAFYSLSGDMKLIQQQLTYDRAAAVKSEARLNNLEERVTNVENTQRDIWHDVRGRSGQR